MTVNPAGGAKPVPWGKKYRTPLMNAAFWLFWLTFPLAYYGGVRNNDLYVQSSLVLFCAACIIPLVTKK
ncbi:hypothetical protein [Acetonema longum]|uniref:Uncharacterized protein n=1 Tax=Acetonema longum DSM 6540 TaxID=1009370 RepID=F7NP41_9FIRM|nr:hypothetical protein [Acetonema longum]EGO62164.1 hypothetical protein ALO_19412 [Acetonema longum DSM 6540]